MTKILDSCYECDIKLTKKNRGKWGPDYWCQDCDKKRVDRISKGFEECLKQWDNQPPKGET